MNKNRYKIDMGTKISTDIHDEKLSDAINCCTKALAILDSPRLSGISDKAEAAVNTLKKAVADKVMQICLQFPESYDSETGTYRMDLYNRHYAYSEFSQYRTRLEYNHYGYVYIYGTATAELFAPAFEADIKTLTDDERFNLKLAEQMNDTIRTAAKSAIYGKNTIYGNTNMRISYLEGYIRHLLNYKDEFDADVPEVYELENIIHDLKDLSEKTGLYKLFITKCTDISGCLREYFSRTEILSEIHKINQMLPESRVFCTDKNTELVYDDARLGSESQWECFSAEINRITSKITNELNSLLVGKCIIIQSSGLYEFIKNAEELMKKGMTAQSIYEFIPHENPYCSTLSGYLRGKLDDIIELEDIACDNTRQRNKNITEILDDIKTHIAVPARDFSQKLRNAVSDISDTSYQSLETRFIDILSSELHEIVSESSFRSRIPNNRLRNVKTLTTKDLNNLKKQNLTNMRNDNTNYYLATVMHLSHRTTPLSSNEVRMGMTKYLAEHIVRKMIPYDIIRERLTKSETPRVAEPETDIEAIMPELPNVFTNTDAVMQKLDDIKADADCLISILASIQQELLLSDDTAFVQYLADTDVVSETAAKERISEITRKEPKPHELRTDSQTI